MPMHVIPQTAPVVGRISAPVRTIWWGHLLWVVAAAMLGWAVTTVFAGMLQLPRALFLVPYVGLTSLLLAGYMRWSGIDVMERFRHHWGWGLIGAALVGAFLIWSVRNQPASAHAQGLALTFDLLWLGVVYGLIDGLLLSVLPVLATWQALSRLGWTERWPGRIAAGTLALAASLFVTAAYHVGYPEFRSPQIISPMIGVGTMSLAYLRYRVR